MCCGVESPQRERFAGLLLPGFLGRHGRYWGAFATRPSAFIAAASDCFDFQ